MKIAFGAISFELEHFSEGETFTVSSGRCKCTIEKITDQYCQIHFDFPGLSNFKHKYPMPYRLLPEKYEQLKLF